jgi:hypothetical protein
MNWEDLIGIIPMIILGWTLLMASVLITYLVFIAITGGLTK